MLSNVLAYLRGSSKVASAIRHFATAAGASFAVAVLPLVQAAGAGHYDVGAAKALVVAAFAGAIAAGARAVVPAVLGLVASKAA